MGKTGSVLGSGLGMLRWLGLAACGTLAAAQIDANTAQCQASLMCVRPPPAARARRACKRRREGATSP